MEILKIIGGAPLTGTVRASGAKNAISKMLVASLLSDKECLFRNVPNITEVEITVDLCKEIGMEVDWDKKNRTLKVVTKTLKSTYVPQRFSGANRIPILIIGALLGRTDADIVVPTVGGDQIGKRPVDFHIEALRSLGAKVEYREMKKDGAWFAQAHEGLHGAVIELPYPSVGATENTILAACRASGTTIIKNAAMECEIIDLILFLQKMGVHIHVDVNRVIHIRETKIFYDVEHTVITDRIEAASFGIAAISTKGRVFVEGAKQEHMLTFLNKLREINGGFRVYDHGIEFFYAGPLKGGLHIETDVHPGFMTDWQQPLVPLLTQVDGCSVIHETVHENRFGYTKILKEMGADIEVFTQCLGPRACRFAEENHHHSIVIKGPRKLHGKDIVIPDLRAGFAYIVAALISKEECTLSNIHYLDRGYETLEEKLSSLGANIVRVKAEVKEEELITV
ncbi:MAG: UDP-N-acetylglucosamine 1-carboxyvinyltransferase [Verrucomicrobia bacterium]|nr:UDP-N-acetylglucosamine 1-carboxyvinyltransferase [Verrucomicrobiota bacterium]